MQAQTRQSFNPLIQALIHESQILIAGCLKRLKFIIRIAQRISNSQMTDLVLVTGLSGFIASHVTAKLLEQGYAVRRFVQHIASPFPLEAPVNREALVPAARAGAMRVIEQAIGAGAERVVMTSSMVAMMGQPGRGDHMLVKEEDWSNPDWKPLTAYPVSKTRAERAVWDYVEAQNLKTRLTTVCPGLVFGPDSYNNGGASLGLISAMFSGDFPRTPKIAWPVSDVRDIAAVHVAAMTANGVGGRRLIAAGQTLWLREISEILRNTYPKAKKLPKGDMANWIVKIIGLVDSRVKGVIPDLGTFHEADAGYVTSLTGVIPRPAKEAILSAAESLIANGNVSLD